MDGFSFITSCLLLHPANRPHPLVFTCLQHLRTSSEPELHPLPAHCGRLCMRPAPAWLPRVPARHCHQPGQITFPGDSWPSANSRVSAGETFPWGAKATLCSSLWLWSPRFGQWLRRSVRFGVSIQIIALGSWRSCLTSLSLRFLTCKTEDK